jgi:hypothetical protein
VFTKCSNAGMTSRRNVLEWARKKNKKIRQLYERFAGARWQPLRPA